MMMRILSPEELKQLTQKKQSTSQREVLNFMGIDHRMRPDGSVVVFENDLINQTPIKEKEFKIND
jgi:hypothetical protein